ncbi:hypothetical protein [Hoeflea phototrophica]|nr:hypothetical protein [Hoeflea phototrophica]
MRYLWLKQFTAREETMKKAILAAAFVLTTTAGAFAQTGSQCVFTIHNDTSSNTAIGFYTSPDDGANWSANWLSQDLEPGQAAIAEFTADTCYCDQVFQASWLGEGGGEVFDDPHTIDICEASNVYLGDDEISFD